MAAGASLRSATRAPATPSTVLPFSGTASIARGMPIGAADLPSRVAATRQGQSSVPIGPPRTIESVPLKGSTVDGVASARIALGDAAPVATKP